jgi:hypothetical protein
MRDVNGWVVGALGAAALVGAFYLGGRVAAAPGATTEGAVPAAMAAAAPAGAIEGFEFACEPGQRVVMRDATATAAASMTCVSVAGPLASPAAAAMAPAVLPVAAPGAANPYVHRTVNTGPIEEYRPRSVPVSYPSEDRRPVRSKTKSAVIIGSSAAIGATIGGLTKGTKGAVVGGIVGGGAATVWDQVTRRRDSGR